MSVESRYLDGTYLAENPDWDSADARWKADMIGALFKAHGIQPSSIADVGCGSGEVLANLMEYFPETAMTGFDISPQLAGFWKKHQSINFRLGDFHKLHEEKFDTVLMLDVFEHVRDPFSFLELARTRAKNFVFHIPLDLSAFSVLRGSPLMNVRKSVGHLHYYTKELALQTLKDCGYSIDSWHYTGAYRSPSIRRSWKTNLAVLPRWLACLFNKDAGVRLLGGETLLVLAHADHVTTRDISRNLPSSP